MTELDEEEKRVFKILVDDERMNVTLMSTWH